jgi:hypothetical protein
MASEDVKPLNFSSLSQFLVVNEMKFWERFVYLTFKYTTKKEYLRHNKDSLQIHAGSRNRSLYAFPHTPCLGQPWL